MNTHDTFYLAHRAHNLLQPLIEEAKAQGINLYMSLNVGAGEPFGSPLSVHVTEVMPDRDLESIGYSSFSRDETLKEQEDQLDGLVEHVRDALAVRANLRTLVIA